MNQEAVLFEDPKEIEHLEKAQYGDILTYDVFGHRECMIELMAPSECKIGDVNEKGGHLGPVEDAFGKVFAF